MMEKGIDINKVSTTKKKIGVNDKQEVVKQLKKNKKAEID